MKVIQVVTDGRYTHHGIGYTQHDGYQGTSDNRLAIKTAILYEMRYINTGEKYQVSVNDKNDGTVHVKS